MEDEAYLPKATMNQFVKENTNKSIKSSNEVIELLLDISNGSDPLVLPRIHKEPLPVDLLDLHLGKQKTTHPRTGSPGSQGTPSSPL